MMIMRMMQWGRTDQRTTWTVSFTNKRLHSPFRHMNNLDFGESSQADRPSTAQLVMRNERKQSGKFWWELSVSEKLWQTRCPSSKKKHNKKRKKHTQKNTKKRDLEIMSAGSKRERPNWPTDWNTQQVCQIKATTTTVAGASQEIRRARTSRWKKIDCLALLGTASTEFSFETAGGLN